MYVVWGVIGLCSTAHIFLRRHSIDFCTLTDQSGINTPVIPEINTVTFRIFSIQEIKMNIFIFVLFTLVASSVQQQQGDEEQRTVINNYNFDSSGGPPVKRERGPRGEKGERGEQGPTGEQVICLIFYKINIYLYCVIYIYIYLPFHILIASSI